MIRRHGGHSAAGWFNREKFHFHGNCPAAAQDTALQAFAFNRNLPDLMQPASDAAYSLEK
jgi:hypothetical protein